jgi:oligopeptide/dipeptide ABC transporter ATP-binding protein
MNDEIHEHDMILVEEMEEYLLNIDALRTYIYTYRGVVKAVDGVSCKIGKGESVGIVGESGSGKSMTALSIMRFTPPGAKFLGGAIFFEGINLLELSDAKIRKIRGCKIAMVFQDPMTYLNPVMKVGDQIAEVFIKHGNMDKKEARQQAVEALNIVRIASPSNVAKQYPHQLSGGMRQRALIAMAISCSPSFLIADEPTTALDVTVQVQIIDLLKEIKEEFGLSLLLITHDLGIVAHLCDKIYVMYAGKIMEEGDVFSIFRSSKHPYASGLIESVLYKDKPGGMVSYIDGSVPDLLNPPTGCRFHPRCHQAMPICREQEPPKFQVSTTQSTFCWLYR